MVLKASIMIRFAVILFVSHLVSGARCDFCNLEDKLALVKGLMFNAQSSKSFSTYNSLQCHDLCRRNSHCKAFMFKMDPAAIGKKMECTIMFDGVEVRKIGNHTILMCTEVVCYTSGYIDRTKPIGIC